MKSPLNSPTNSSSFMHDMCTQYKGLIHKVALKICPKNLKSLLLDDLIQEGYIALYKALKNYDHTKETKFTSYAYMVLLTNMRDFLASQRYSIALSVSAYRSIQKYLYRDINGLDQGLTDRQLDNIEHLIKFTEFVCVDDINLRKFNKTTHLGA